MNIYTPKEMQAIDQRTINSGIPSQELMERAGEACFQVLEDRIKKSDKILVICGSGNNGGDGQVTARLLKEHHYNVTVLFTVTSDELQKKMSPESTNNYLKLESLGIPLNYAANEDTLKERIPEYNVIIDAVFGTGFNRELSSYYKALFNTINQSKAKVISIDIPSGLNGYNGKAEVAVKAELTIIIQSPKTGELLEDGPDHTGDTVVVSIGLNEDKEPSKRIIDNSNVKFPVPRYKNSHKYHYGRILIIAGSKGMLGTSALASKAALKTGAGLVTTFVPEDLYSPTVAIQPPEVLVESYDRILTTYKLSNFKRDVILIGPGINTKEDFSGLLISLLKEPRPVVIDAGGLSMMKYQLKEFKSSKAPVVITPHQGEFAELLKISVDELKNNALHYAAQFSQDYNVIVVLKGHNTIVAAPNGEIWFNITGNPGMATPGSGDVLAGMIAAILGQIKDPLEAAKAGVYYHGLAGDKYADEFGETTLIAGDIIDSLKYVLR